MFTSRREFIQFLSLGFFVIGCTKTEEFNKQLTFLYPKSNSKILFESEIIITWESKNIDKLDLLYSVDNGINWEIIQNKINAQEGRFLWTPKFLGKVQLRLKDSDSFLFVISDIFEISDGATIDLREYSDLNTPNKNVMIKNKFFDDFSITNLGGGKFEVISLKCTHAGCTIENTGEVFECPCHGSIFGLNGCVKQGPAKLNLNKYENFYDVEKMKLTILRKIIPPQTC